MRILLLSISLLFSALAVSGQVAAPACITNRNAPPVSAYYWPPDAEVKVYFTQSTFTESQKSTLFAAMQAWSDAAFRTGAGVSFSYAGETAKLVNCSSCLTITRRAVFKSDRKHYAFFNPLRQSDDGLLISAWIDFDYATVDPHALQGFMAHEMGHGMGLWDCTTCKKRETIMNAFPSINSDNGLIAPSACDLAVVRHIYELQRRVSNNVVAGNHGRKE